MAGFVGHLNARTDLALLEAVVDRGLTLVLVGPIDAASGGPRLDELLDRKTVHAVGPCDFEEVAAWLWSVDVGLVPYRNDEFNRWSFPLKTLEYLAAGLPVVSTGLPASKWLADADIGIADSPEDFGETAWQMARAAEDERAVMGRQAFAAGHSWDQRAALLLETIRAPRVEAFT